MPVVMGGRPVVRFRVGQILKQTQALTPSENALCVVVRIQGSTVYHVHRRMIHINEAHREDFEVVGAQEIAEWNTLEVGDYVRQTRDSDPPENPIVKITRIEDGWLYHIHIGSTTTQYDTANCFRALRAEDIPAETPARNLQPPEGVGNPATEEALEEGARIQWVTYQEHASGTEEKKKPPFKCDICGKEKPFFDEVGHGSSKEYMAKISKAVGKKVEKYCMQCYEKFSTCHQCNEVIFRPNDVCGGNLRTRNSNIYVCGNCLDQIEEDVLECDECSHLIYPECGYGYHDETLCYRCYGDSKNDIFDPQLGRGEYTEFPATTFRGIPKRSYGVEIEALATSNSISKEECRPWMRYEDGSLDDDGEEFASPIFRGDSGLVEIQKLLDLLHKNNYEVESCCAVHCHVDAKDYRHNDLRRFLLFMHDYEPTLFSMIRRPCSGGAQQLNSNMTRVAIKKTKKINTLKTVIYGTRYCDPPTSKWSNIRYRGLNLHSFFFRGTVEFRYLGATLYYNEISSFTRLCVHAAEYGRLYKLRSVKKPTLKEMVKILKFPKDLAEYYGKWQRHYDEKRGIQRPEEERVPCAD